MLSAYPACFYKESTGYSVVFPDLDNLATCGETLNEALEMAIDCLAGYLYECNLDGTNLNEPSDLNSINKEAVAKELDFEYESSFVNIVAVDVEEYAKKHFNKSVKKTLTIPSWLNDLALKENVNFSGILQNALMEHLHVSK